jgi:hypothetical protein
MNIIYGICLIAAAIAMLVYRESIGRMMPEPEWMSRYLGGRYTFTVLLGIIVFFWGVSVMTGLTGIMFAPLRWLLSAGLG